MPAESCRRPRVPGESTAPTKLHVCKFHETGNFAVACGSRARAELDRTI